MKKHNVRLYIDFDNTIVYNKFAGEEVLMKPELNEEIVKMLTYFSKKEDYSIDVLTARKSLKIVEDYLKKNALRDIFGEIYSSASYAEMEWSQDGKGNFIIDRHRDTDDIVILVDDVSDYLLYADSVSKKHHIRFAGVQALRGKTSRNYIEEVSYQVGICITRKIFSLSSDGSKFVKESFLKAWALKEETEHIEGGRAEGQPDSRYDPNQLAIGTKIEMEHTNDREIAKEIAKDHLEEIPDYYTRLNAMEREARGFTTEAVYFDEFSGFDMITEEVPVGDFKKLNDYNQWWKHNFNERRYKESTNWKLQSPDSYEKTKKGNCIDVAMFHYANLSKLKAKKLIKDVKLAYVAELEDGHIIRGHMFVFLQNRDGMYYNFGNSMLGPYKTFAAMADHRHIRIIEQYNEDISKHQYFYLDPTKFPVGSRRRDIRKIIEKLKPLKLKLKKIKYKTSKISDLAILDSTDERGKIEAISTFLKKNVRYSEIEIVKTPKQVLEKRQGDCHSQAIFTRWLCNQHGIKCTLLFFIEYNDDSPVGGKTHTLAYATIKGKIYWMENAWEDQQGIHKFTSLKKLQEKLTALHEKENSYSKYPNLLFINDASPISGVTLGDYVKEQIRDDLVNEEGNMILNEHAIDYKAMKKEYPHGGWFHERFAAIKWIAGKPHRHRCEVLVFKGDMLYMRRYDVIKNHDPNWTYTLPGGGSEAYLGIHDDILVQREAAEEANLRLRNVLYTEIVKTKSFGENGSTFMPFDGKLKSWAQEMVDAGFAYHGDWSKVYIADYDGENTAIIDPIDEDKDMWEFGKFYHLEDIKHLLRKEHMDTIKKYRPFLLGPSENLKMTLKEISVLVSTEKELANAVVAEGYIKYKDEFFRVEQVDVYIDRYKNVPINEAGDIAVGIKAKDGNYASIVPDHISALSSSSFLSYKANLQEENVLYSISLHLRKDFILKEGEELLSEDSPVGTFPMKPIGQVDSKFADSVRMFMDDLRISHEFKSHGNAVYLLRNEDTLLEFDRDEPAYIELIEGIQSIKKPFTLSEDLQQQNLYTFKISDELLEKLKSKLNGIAYEIPIDSFQPKNPMYKTLLKTI